MCRHNYFIKLEICNNVFSREAEYFFTTFCQLIWPLAFVFLRLRFKRLISAGVAVATTTARNHQRYILTYCIHFIDILKFILFGYFTELKAQSCFKTVFTRQLLLNFSLILNILLSHQFYSNASSNNIHCSQIFKTFQCVPKRKARVGA